ncbi:MAG: DUF1223 domain-containing protein [Gammaproteobacteria bacterium]|nr:DUF1223 domain-containing protein [Gammaproteobacteria bacterium]
MKPTLLLLTLYCFLISSAQAETVTFSSSNKRVNLLELYTSEGCSSCPPADQWLSRFQNDDTLWKELIPVAFHVDYWNYIGWPDRFASPRYSKRQRDYAINGNVSTVYTPGILLNGREWRSWHYMRPLDLGNSENAGKLSVDLNNDKFTAHFQTVQKPTLKVYLNIVILGFDLITKVKAGENRGRELEHDFVVLGYSRRPMVQMENSYSVSDILPEQIAPAVKTGLAAWVDYADDLTPVQATGGWLSRKN